MSRYGRCGGCARATTCGFLADAKKALAGHGKLISSVKVNCRRAYEVDFEPGDRVRIKTLQDFPDRFTMPISSKAATYLGGSFGTVMSWSKSGKVNVILDPDDEGVDVLYIPTGEYTEDMEWCRVQSFQHRDLAKIDEPKRELCAGCNIVADAEGKPETWRGKNRAIAGGCNWPGFEGCIGPRETFDASTGPAPWETN